MTDETTTLDANDPPEILPTSEPQPAAPEETHEDEQDIIDEPD